MATNIEIAEALYRLKLGEVANFKDCCFSRVIGGWVYTSSEGVCFIPWNNEFKAIK